MNEKVMDKKDEKILLIYGFDAKRKDYCDSKNIKYSYKHYSTFIDGYNKEIIRILNVQMERKKKGMVSVWDSLKNFNDFSEAWPNEVMELKKEWSLWKDYYKCTQTNEKNKLINLYKHNFTKKPAPYPQASKFYQHVLRGCKIGLDIAIMNPDVEIHFCLDDIDLKKVINKKTLEGQSVTSSEIRYIFRNWKDLKDKVKFVMNKTFVEAPWDQDPESWKEYQPKKKLRMVDLKTYQKSETQRKNITKEIGCIVM